MVPRVGEKATLCHHQSEPYHVGRWYMVKNIQIHLLYIHMGYVIAPLVTRWRAMISSITAAGCTDHFLFFVFSLSAPRVKKMNEQKNKRKKHQ